MPDRSEVALAFTVVGDPGEIVVVNGVRFIIEHITVSKTEVRDLVTGELRDVRSVMLELEEA